MSPNNDFPSNDDHPDSDDAYISKTKKKQMVHELQDLAKHIAQMPKKKIQQLDLPESLLDAIAESKRITSHIASKRHFQYMGKLLLKSDHEAIKQRLDQIENTEGHYQIRDAVINLWIEHFTDHEKALFNHLYGQFEQTELSALRQILRKHLKQPEAAAERKKLFQALRKLDQVNELPNPLTVI